jgi:uncharacterized protein (TIGR02996 family)
MTQQEALYRAVCAHPDEDTPRLIFADFLEEAGDALRAEFIRTQVALARVPDTDPLWAECRRRRPNAIRGWGMAHTLPPLPAGCSWSRFEFRRGFPWVAAVTDLSKALSTGDSLFNSAPIQALDFECNASLKSGFDAFCEWPYLSRLRRLAFSHTRFDAFRMRSLGHSPFATALSELCFEGHAIEAEGLEALAASPLFGRLASFELHRAAISPALAIDALAAFNDCREAPEKSPPRKQGVSLDPCLRVGLSEEITPHSGGLERLSVSDCKFPPPDLAHLLDLPFCETIQALDLSHNRLGAEGCEALARSRAIRGLIDLNLAATNPGVPGIAALGGSLHRIRKLSLANNRLGPTATKRLATADLTELRVLDLSGNPIGDSGASALCELAAPRLVELNVRSCGLDDASRRRLTARFNDILVG